MDKCDIAGFEKEKGGGVIGRGFGKRRGNIFVLIGDCWGRGVF